MMAKVNTGTIIIIIIIILFLIWLFFPGSINVFRRKEKEDITKKSNDIKIINPCGDNNCFPLKNGSKNNCVKTLQLWLNDQPSMVPLANLIVDGQFGPLTESALKKVTGLTQINTFTQFQQLTGKIC